MGAHFSLMGSPGGTRWHGLVDPLKEYRPVFGVFQIFKEWGDSQVQVDTTEPKLLPAFASIQEDETLAILILNKDLSSDQSANLKVRGFRPEGGAKIWQEVDGIPEVLTLDPMDLGSEFFYLGESKN